MKRISQSIVAVTVLSFVACGGPDPNPTQIGGSSDLTLPTISSTSPTSSATGVAANTAILVTFSEAMSSSTINETTFTVKAGSTVVPGTVSYSGTIATFTPADNLAYSTSYTATVTTGAKDLAGNALLSNYVLTFTTGTAPNTGLLANSFEYAGSYPVPASVVFMESGSVTSVTAYPGQVIVFFTTSTGLTDAAALIKANAGTILTQFPVLGYYLVSVTSGSERTFISSINSDPRVYFAVPNLTASNRGTTVIEEDCNSNHAIVVGGENRSYGGTIDTCFNAGEGLGTERAVMERVVNETINIVAASGGQTTFINQSLGPEVGSDIIMLPGIDQPEALKNWVWGTRIVLAAIAQMPEIYRENLVVTIAAGNSNIHLEALMADLRKDPKIASILRNNVVIGTTELTSTGTFAVAKWPTGKFANTAPGDPDIIVMNNPNAALGTSFAAPALLGVIEKNLADLKTVTGASTALAIKAIKLAVATNANHELVMEEARDKVKVIREAETNDSVGSYSVTGISLSAGSSTSSVINPAISGVTVQYTVSGTDGYYDSGSLQTDSFGRVSFSIPPGGSGVVDTISVTAVLSGRVASSTINW